MAVQGTLRLFPSAPDGYRPRLVPHLNPAQIIESNGKIVIALHETIRLMAEIDKVIDAHGGWPGAFARREKKPNREN